MSEDPRPAAADSADAPAARQVARQVGDGGRISAAQLAAAQRILAYWWSRSAPAGIPAVDAGHGEPGDPATPLHAPAPGLAAPGAATLQQVADATVAVMDGQPRAERFDDGHDAR